MKVIILVLLCILVFVVVALVLNRIVNSKWFRMRSIVKEYEEHKKREEKHEIKMRSEYEKFKSEENSVNRYYYKN